jgi:hypothetical protein
MDVNLVISLHWKTLELNAVVFPAMFDSQRVGNYEPTINWLCPKIGYPLVNVYITNWKIIIFNR